MNIQVKDVYYYGYKQGVKVYINGKKYPLKRGHVYAEYTDNNRAIKEALKEKGEWLWKNNILKLLMM